MTQTCTSDRNTSNATLPLVNVKLQVYDRAFIVAKQDIGYTDQ